MHSIFGERPNSRSILNNIVDFAFFPDSEVMISACTIQRLLFTTEKGCIGLAPYTAEVGDKVCLLKGAQFPIILRSEKKHWVLVGESYIHGIMDGEGWREMMSEQNTECRKQTFNIR